MPAFAFVPALLAGLGVFARFVVASLIAKVLIVAGVGIGTTLVLEPLIADMLGQAEGALLAIPSPFSNYLALARVDEGLAIIAGGALARAQIGGLRLIASGVT